MSNNARESSIKAARARREPGSAATVKRNQVVDKAAELFDAAGYHNTGVADIAAAAGISKPTLYHYFAGKDEILFWIHEDFMEKLIERQEKRGRISMAPSAWATASKAPAQRTVRRAHGATVSVAFMPGWIVQT